MSENPFVVYKKQELVFCVDIESGSGENRRFPWREYDDTTGDVIGIGAAVAYYDYEKNEYVFPERFLAGLYRPGKGGKPAEVGSVKRGTSSSKYSIFNEDCWKYFWTKPEKLPSGKEIIPAEYVLPKLVDPNRKEMSREESERKAINELRKFVIKWNENSKEMGFKFRLVTDCAPFDYGLIDQMNWEHCPNEKGILKWGSSWNGAVRCVTTREEALLGLVDNHWMRRSKTEPGESDDITMRLHKLYGVGPPPFEHDHLPNNDAAFQCWRYLVSKNIEDGIYKLNTDLVEKHKEEPPFLLQAFKKPRFE